MTSPLDDDPWLRRLLFLLCVMVSSLLHSVVVWVPEPERPPEVRVEIDLVRPRPPSTPAPPNTTSDAPRVDTPAVSTTPAPTASSAKTAPTNWNDTFFGRTRGTLDERNRAATKAADVRRTLLATTENMQPWPTVQAPTADVHQCNAEDLVALDVDTRSVAHWGPLLPGGLFSPDYAEQLHQVFDKGRRPQRLSRHVRFALPAEVLEVPLESPAGAVLLVGHPDVRCAMHLSFSLGKDAPFPLLFRDVPLRVVTADAQVSRHRARLNFYADGRFSLVAVDGGPLPFTEGRILRARQLAGTFDGYKTLVQLSRDMFSDLSD